MALVKYNNNSISAITAASSLPTGAMTLIKEQTASSSATISFVDGTSDVVLDSTYPIYLFKFINIHPATDSTAFQVNFRDGGSSYDATKTTTYVLCKLLEDNSGDELSYKTGLDLAQSTAVQKLTVDVDNANDASQSGEMWLFNPSSTTFVKHFMSRVQTMQTNSGSMENYTAGYCNVTAAIDGVQFSMSSGNMDAGTIKLYGIKDS
jgi:hypothetical protein